MTEYNLLLTLDYELPINKPPDVMRYMIKPTEALLNVCQFFGAKLTIMLEIGELWAFEKAANKGFAEHVGYDVASRIRNQLVQAIKLGHDVQLHLHPQWLDAEWAKDAWHLNYSKYQLTGLDYHEMVDVFRSGKKYLESLLSPHSYDYSCIGFRAGNWITQPSRKYLKALYEAGLKSDTSVFKWGYADGPAVYFDYREAYSNILPWFVSKDNINLSSTTSNILEMPIYAQQTNLLGMINMKRLKLAGQYLSEDKLIESAIRNSQNTPTLDENKFVKKAKRIFQKYPKKLDFCKLTSREMVKMVENIIHQYSIDPPNFVIPIVMIGHSKEIGARKDLGKFLSECQRRFDGLIKFSNFRDTVRECFKNADKLLEHSICNNELNQNNT